MTISTESKKLAFFIFYFLFFFVAIDWSVVAVLFAPLLIPATSPFLSPSISMQKRNLMLGFLTAMFPLAQLFGAIIIGELSDRFGRKRILTLTTLGTAIGFALSGFAIFAKTLLLMFISRLLTGFVAGNMTLSQAGVADLTDIKNRSRYLAVFVILAGFSWTLGPLLANWLSDSKLIPWFNLATPFFFIAAIFFIIFLLVLFGLQETFITKKSKLALHQAFGNILTVFRIKKIRIPILLYGLMFFGWFVFLWFFSAYLIEKFKLNKEQISIMFAYLSLWFILGGILSNQWLFKKFNPDQVIKIPLFLFAISLIISAFFTKVEYFWFTLPFAGACQAIVVAGLLSINSKLAGADKQGKIFGTLNALMALCTVLAPPFAGAIANLSLNLPALVAGILLLITAISYWQWQRK